MKKEAIALMLVLALSMMMPMMAMKTTSAHTIGNSYPTGSTSLNTSPIDWINTTAAATLAWNPEYLKLETILPVETSTTILVDGYDTYGQPIEAKVFMPAGSGSAGTESSFIFNDSVLNEPVAFAKITDIYQQNGTHNDQFEIFTNSTYAQYLGQYHYSSTSSIPSWQPGVYSYSPGDGTGSTKYLKGMGPGIHYTVQNTAVEPTNPDPLRIYINWHESDLDLYPDLGELGTEQATTTWLMIEGLDECGNKLCVNTTIPIGASFVDVTGCGDATWSCVCDVIGPSSSALNSYYIFTWPMPDRLLCTYTTLIDHMTIYANSYDILANPSNLSTTPGVSLYPGVTNITVALVDQDGNLIHPAPGENVSLNFATSGGTIEPSCDVWLSNSNLSATVNLTADTGARTVKVSADADVPSCSYAPELNLYAWTEVTFDGVDSMFSLAGQAWPIHEMQWGYDTGIVDPTTLLTTWIPGFNQTLAVPPEPPLPPYLGGPDPANAPYTFKFDGPLYEVSIPLYVGCNLISSPVVPMMNYNLTENDTEYYGSSYGGHGIPMSLLFNNTDSENVEMIWWYCYGNWYYYIPATNQTNVNSGLGPAYFTDGLGYWIMCDKPCTLEISGVDMQNAPFTPPTYELPERSWSLMGVTSITGYPNYADYLESTLEGETYTGTTVTVGPIWVWNAQYRFWTRDPSWGLWPTQGFWIYNAYPLYQNIAP
jgi:hypothetical protein